MTGTQIANYTILQVLGTGGMGTVYLAKNQSIGSKVAIKMLHPHLIKSESLKVRFLKEAKTQAILSHPNITKVIDFVDNEKGVFIILEHIEGIPLDEYLFHQKGLMPEKEANHYFAKILDAVGYAHSKNVIHRDLKCANIMVTPHQGIKIMDFGIAKMAGENMSLTKTGSRMGSPLYMSPEQVKSGNVDSRSDIYALGVVYHEMLTGRPVYNQHTTSEYEIYDKIVKEPLQRLQNIYGLISDHAQNVVDKATAKAPRDRFQSCEEFKQTLLNASQGRQQSVPKAKEPVVKSRQRSKENIAQPKKAIRKKNHILLFGVILITIALLGGGVYYFSNNQSATQENNSVAIKMADNFTKEGNYKEAYLTYQNILSKYPKTGWRKKN